MAKRHWNLGIIRLFNDVLYNEALAADTPGLTNGLRYHLIDICVDELAKVNRDAELQLTEATFLDCLEPFFGVAQNAEDKNVHKRVMDNVLLKFLNEYSFVSSTALEEEDVDEEEKALVFNQVHVGSVSTLIFQIASDPDTDERYRKALYEMHKTYVRQVRLAGRDVDLDQYQDNDEDDDDEEKRIDDMDEDGQQCEKSQEAEEEGRSEEQDDTVTSTKKKKHKKKKKKVDKESSEDDNESPEMPKTAKEEVTATPETKSSKKKRKQKDSKTVEVALETPEEESSMTTPSSKKKRKKEQSDDSKSTDKNNSDLITSHVETPKVGESKKKKKKKQKKDKSPPSVDPRSMNSPDQVVDSPTNSDNDDDTKDARASKRKNRVSFGSMNHCKSHKASMKAIKSLEKERWDTVHRTPEKGILQTKIGSSSAAKSSAKKGQPPSSRKKKGKKKN